MVRKKAIRAFFILLGLIIAFYSFWLFLGYRIFYGDLPHREKLVAEIQEFVEKPLQSITILPESPYDQALFEYVISDRSDLQVFEKAARRTDLTRISGHSLPIFQATIILRNADSENRYIVSVHIREPEDLFVSNVFYEEIDGGLFGKHLRRENPKEVRIPGIGMWIMRLAPAGVSESGAHILEGSDPATE